MLSHLFPLPYESIMLYRYFSQLNTCAPLIMAILLPAESVIVISELMLVAPEIEKLLKDTWTPIRQ